jgi:hypothetical protein
MGLNSAIAKNNTRTIQLSSERPGEGFETVYTSPGIPAIGREAFRPHIIQNAEYI